MNIPKGTRTIAALEILSLVEIESVKNSWSQDDFVFVDENRKLHPVLWITEFENIWVIRRLKKNTNAFLR